MITAWSTASGVEIIPPQRVTLAGWREFTHLWRGLGCSFQIMPSYALAFSPNRNDYPLCRVVDFLCSTGPENPNLCIVGPIQVPSLTIFSPASLDCYSLRSQHVPSMLQCLLPQAYRMKSCVLSAPLRSSLTLTVWASTVQASPISPVHLLGFPKLQMLSLNTPCLSTPIFVVFETGFLSVALEPVLELAL